MENADDEAPKDPGIEQPAHQGYTEKDFEGKFNFLYLSYD